VIGCGYWGPNLVRNFRGLQEFDLVGVADLDGERLAHVARQHRIERTTARPEDLIDDDAVEAVAIATPVSTHAALARRALERGKHVLVTKPLAQSVEECDELVALAERAGRLLLVDHT